MARKLTANEILNKIEQKFPNKFDLTEYRNQEIEYTTKIHVKCNDCGYEFDTSPKTLLQSSNKYGCKQCYQNNRSRVTKEDVIKKVNEKYGDQRFNFSKFTFNDIHDEAILICNNCGSEILVTVSDLTRNRKVELCSNCKKKENFNTYCEKFKEKVKEKFGNAFNLDGVQYTNAKSKVQIKCNTCNSTFEITPDSLLHSKYGCPVCSEKSRRQNKKLSIEEFIKDSNNIHNFKYDYSQVQYVDRDTEVKIICPVHGEFRQKPRTHLKGCGCQKCAIEDRTNSSRKTRDEFISESKLIHGDYYNYNEVDYVNRTTPVSIICPIHGEFKQSPEKHLRGHGCQLCKRSKGEVLVANILNDLKIPYQEQYTINVDNKTLIVDFFAKGKYIEYNGKQHYESINFFGGEEKFIIQQNRDILLREYCKNNNIELLEISYKLNVEDVKNLIQDFYEI